ncbi:hypothetical protein Tco_1182587 [Tanacetum coccineum]
MEDKTKALCYERLADTTKEKQRTLPEQPDSATNKRQNNRKGPMPAGNVTGDNTKDPTLGVLMDIISRGIVRTEESTTIIGYSRCGELSPCPRMNRCIKDWGSLLKTPQRFRQFWALPGYYRRFIEAEAVQCTNLAYPEGSKILSHTVMLSKEGFGAVLMQREKGGFLMQSRQKANVVLMLWSMKAREPLRVRALSDTIGLDLPTHIQNAPERKQERWRTSRRGC